MALDNNELEDEPMQRPYKASLLEIGVTVFLALVFLFFYVKFLFF